MPPTVEELEAEFGSVRPSWNDAGASNIKAKKRPKSSTTPHGNRKSATRSLPALVAYPDLPEDNAKSGDMRVGAGVSIHVHVSSGLGLCGGAINSQSRHRQGRLLPTLHRSRKPAHSNRMRLASASDRSSQCSRRVTRCFKKSLQTLQYNSTLTAGGLPRACTIQAANHERGLRESNTRLLSAS